METPEMAAALETLGAGTFGAAGRPVRTAGVRIASESSRLLCRAKIRRTSERETGFEPGKEEQIRALGAHVRTNHGADACAMSADAYASKAIEGPDASRERAEHGAAGRGDAIGRLAGMLATFATAGDLEGARTMHEAIGRLLGAVPRRGDGAPVVDLEAARQRRAG